VGEEDIFGHNAGLRDTLDKGFGGRTEGFDVLKFIDYKSTDTEAYIAQSKCKKKVVMSVRGSESYRDWAMNAQTFHTRWEPKVDGESAGWCACLDACMPGSGDKPMVHLGFYTIFLKLKKLVEETLVNICRGGEVEEICFCGHSLGGAVATLYVGRASETSEAIRTRRRGLCGPSNTP